MCAPTLKLLRKDSGLVKVEWVGISAVLVLTTMAITAFTMQGADAAGGNISTGSDSVESSDPLLGDGASLNWLSDLANRLANPGSRAERRMVVEPGIAVAGVRINSRCSDIRYHADSATACCSSHSRNLAIFGIPALLRGQTIQ